MQSQKFRREFNSETLKLALLDVRMAIGEFDYPTDDGSRKFINFGINRLGLIEKGKIK